MTARGSVSMAFRWVAVLAVVTGTAYAQSCGTTEASCVSTVSNQVRGFGGYEYLSVTSGAFGQVMRLDTSLSYDFNEHFGLDAGIPFYFAHNSPELPGAFSDGAGDFYIDLRFTILNPALNFSSILTGTAPTGNVATGFSTGRATFDWDSRLDRDFGRWRPFADIGIANSIGDSHNDVRPYTTLGLVTHFEGGARYQALRWLAVGGSGYEDLTSGPQKIYSRVFPRGAPSLAGCNGLALFACASEVAGSAGIARDHGFLIWAQSSSFHGLDARASYTRSVSYQYNSVSLGLGFEFGPLLQKARRLLPARRSARN